MKVSFSSAFYLFLLYFPVSRLNGGALAEDACPFQASGQENALTLATVEYQPLRPESWSHPLLTSGNYLQCIQQPVDQ